MPGPQFTIVDVVARFPSTVKARYSFDDAVYEGANLPITGIVCPDHGVFKQYAAQLRKEGGAGCPTCGDVSRRDTQRGSTGEFIAKAEVVHGDEYLYDKTNYVTSKEKVVVTCREHGDFEVTPNNHLKGRGCPHCGAEKRGRNKTPRVSHKPRTDREAAAQAWAEKHGVNVEAARELIDLVR